MGSCGVEGRLLLYHVLSVAIFAITRIGVTCVIGIDEVDIYEAMVNMNRRVAPTNFRAQD